MLQFSARHILTLLSVLLVLALFLLVKQSYHQPEPVPSDPSKQSLADASVFQDLKWVSCHQVAICAPGTLGQRRRQEGIWWTCRELYDHMRRSKDCLVYGLGAGYDVRFDKQLATDGCEVHTFEIAHVVLNAKAEIDKFIEVAALHPGVQSKKHPTLNWFYHNVGVDTEDNLAKNVLSLPTIMTALGHDQRTIHYFKMDIEGPEFRIVDQLLQFSDRIMMLGMEGHPFELNDPPDFHLHYDALKRLESRGFALIRRDFKMIVDTMADNNVYAGFNEWTRRFTEQHPVMHDAFLYLATYSEMYFVNERFLTLIRQAEI